MARKYYTAYEIGGNSFGSFDKEEVDFEVRYWIIGGAKRIVRKTWPSRPTRTEYEAWIAAYSPK
jgi:hypothetical protein